MALPADFSKIFGSTATGGLTPIGDVNYAKGWEFVGSNPPTKNDFSYLQNLSDLKSQWLYSNKLQRTDPFGDIKSDGAESVSTALSNLGLGDGSALPVGVPVPWPSATPPAGWMKCNGSSFNKASFPALAAVYPSGVLPDLRGEFIRGWDDGRGVDSGRGLLSLQSSQNLSHSHDDFGAIGGGAVGVPGTTSVYAKKYYGSDEGFMTRPSNGWTGSSAGLTSLQSGGGESRPRNIAFNYIVRTA